MSQAEALKQMQNGRIWRRLDAWVNDGWEAYKREFFNDDVILKDLPLAYVGALCPAYKDSSALFQELQEIFNNFDNLAKTSNFLTDFAKISGDNTALRRFHRRTYGYNSPNALWERAASYSGPIFSGFVDIEGLLRILQNFEQGGADVDFRRDLKEVSRITQEFDSRVIFAELAKFIRNGNVT
jgi:hypothetical protein